MQAKVYHAESHLAIGYLLPLQGGESLEGPAYYYGDLLVGEALFLLHPLVVFLVETGHDVVEKQDQLVLIIKDPLDLLLYRVSIILTVHLSLSWFWLVRLAFRLSNY